MGIKASSNKIEYSKKLKSRASQNTASSIPLSPLDIEVEHLETFILVWLDENIDGDEQNEALKKRLRQHITILVPFNDLKSCEQWLKTRPLDEKILLIVPGGLGKRIVPHIHELTSIIAIYIFCWEPDRHREWTQNFSKIREIICKEETLVQQISRDQIYFENIEDSKSIKIFKNRPHSRIFDLENTTFIWYQLFLEILISPSYLPLSSASSSELIHILRQSSSNDKESLNLIKEFEQTYDKENAIAWLTNNTPLARFLNKALREQNILILFYLRFFLIDIYNELILNQLSSAHVYRKQIMSLNQIENIQMNINNYLMLNEFLYTSTELSFIDTNQQTQFPTVFIEITAEKDDGTAPFSYLQAQNNSAILFMCGAIFKIISLTQHINSTWILKLSLAGNKQLDILNDKKMKLRKTNDLLMIVELLDQCNQSNKATIYCQQLLKQLPSNHHLISQINNKINNNLLTRSQFILIDLLEYLSPLAMAMLNVLQSLTNDSIVICKNSSEINYEKLRNKTIFIFTNSQIYSSIIKQIQQPKFVFILGKNENENENDQIKYFDKNEDLIFELADQLYRCYIWEINDDLRSGSTSTVNDKQQIANKIHKELKQIHQTFSQNNKTTICTNTTIIWLKLNNSSNNNNIIQNIKTLFEKIVSLFIIFDDNQDCFNHICTTEYNHSVFIIIDNDYQDISIAAFQTLNNIKQIYRYDYKSSSSTNLSSRLIHDLISHYNQLANRFQHNKDLNNAKDMFLKARQLCELLIQI